MAAEEEKNLWQSLLSKAIRSEGNMPDSTLVIVGDQGAGKRGLVGSLRERLPQVVQAENNGAASKTIKRNNGGLVKYNFFPVVQPDDADTDVDTEPTCNVWSIAERRHISFLDCALGNGEGISHTVIMIVLDFQRPAGMIASLKAWLTTLENELRDTVSQHPRRDQIQQSIRDHVRLYRVRMRSNSSNASSTGDIDSKLEGDAHSSIAGGASALDDIELPDGVLTKNLGMPIIVCCNKTDLIASSSNLDQQSPSSSGKSSMIPEDSADYVQQHVREICIKYGAALFFTSSKEGNNIDELHRYLLHRLYPDSDAFKFNSRAEVVDSANIMIPSGFDMPQLIADMKSDIVEGEVSEVLGRYGLPPLPNICADEDKETESGDAETAGSSETKGADPFPVESTADEKKVTAYPEQEFLERLLKRQQAEDRVLGSRSAVDDINLRDEVRSMDASSNPKAPSRDGERLKFLNGKGSATSNSRRKSNIGHAEVSFSTKKGSSPGKNSVSSSNLSGIRAKRSSTKPSNVTGVLKPAGGEAASKDNPKLIKNFFQSLLKPRSGGAAGNGSQSGTNSSSSGTALRRSSRVRKKTDK